MNVDDVKSEKPNGDMLELIFEKQKSLMDKYHEIEISQGVGYGILGGRTFDINETRSQCLIKDFAWRVTEEITEAFESPSGSTHFFEELADALHFLTELCITVDIFPAMISPRLVHSGDRLEILFLATMETPARPDPFQPIYFLGLAMNCLKQKPWKQTHILTDESKFAMYIIQSFHALVDVWKAYGGTAETMYDFYFKKNKVNQFRQETNY